MPPPPGACATCGTYLARCAACLAYVPRVARTPHAPPPAWRMCHAWHVRRTLRRLPGACATRGTYTARSAACLAHVPRVARTPHAPPPAWRMCHAWLNAACVSFVPRVGADQVAAVCGRLLRALQRIGRFVVPHDQVYCLCAQPIRVSTSSLLKIMRDIEVPMLLLKVPRVASRSTRRLPALRTCHAWHHAARAAPCLAYVPRVA